MQRVAQVSITLHAPRSGRSGVHLRGAEQPLFDNIL